MADTADLTTATVDELILELCARYEAQGRGIVVLWEPLDGSEQARRASPPDMSFRMRGSTSACMGMAQRFIATKLRDDAETDTGADP